MAIFLKVVTQTSFNSCRCGGVSDKGFVHVLERTMFQFLPLRRS